MPLQPAPPVHRALLIEDDPEDALIARDLLDEGPGRFHLTVTDRLSSALYGLAQEGMAALP